MSSIKKRFTVGWVAGMAVGIACSTFAGSTNFPFGTGDTLGSTQMQAVQSAVNDNDSRITALENCPTGMVRVGSICVDKYEASISGGVAQSVAGVLPAVNVTWFEAADACAKAGKRLITNAEWQTAAAGTVAANCNTTGNTLANTDANATCVSNFGVVNMVGNASEWVADFSPTAGADISGQNGLIRGGDAGDSATTPYFAFLTPLNVGLTLNGFRCAR